MKKLKQTLKHLFLPIRSTWSSERSDLMFDDEQAYRFAKRITDAGGSVTFSNTTATDGTTSEDEVEILTFMDQQFTINADATVYERPEGAFLVGEEVLSTATNVLEDFSLKVFPNPVKDVFSLTKEVASGVLYNTFGAKSYEFNNQYKNIDISNLSSGLYLLQVNYKDGRKEHLKLLKE